MLFSAIPLLAALAAAQLAYAGIGVHCGTTNDATLSDCKALLNDDATWDGAWAGTSNVCHYSNADSGVINGKAYNTACHGNCCIYYASMVGHTPDKGQTRADAQGLLGCADTDKDAVNGLDFFDDGRGVCISDGSGCGDCFDDADFSGGCSIC
ncbi:hypothetical protein PsYK624_072890 [Phanerochaete sordida]|uniref:Uncharacterized protein n=1 Tax=Phanerochaete sordida TaxID=48140 RepID=A0A9P3GC30_9APHY|nr:hypothetical protein PsYK624_072890 [Phanerochaete sordida]